ncbi:hypothetical protein NQZ68_025946 [Dissostichus eleginoides]|nr:hypothetical protein NQZ68_025946 [Dissostichus eleginoides]
MLSASQKVAAFKSRLSRWPIRASPDCTLLTHTAAVQTLHGGATEQQRSPGDAAPPRKRDTKTLPPWCQRKRARKASQVAVSQPVSQPASQPANSQQAEEGETGQEEASVAFRGKRKRGREMSSFEQSLLSAVSPILAMPPPPPPPVVVEDDEDLLFFKSLLPTMILMSRAKRLRVRFAIHKVVLDADQEEN